MWRPLDAGETHEGNQGWDREGGQDKTDQTETIAKRNACDPTKFSNLLCEI